MTLCFSKPEYSSTFYNSNSVPYLSNSLEEFRKKEAEAFIIKFGALFRDHNVWDKFTLSLVHKHFLIGDKEILVEVPSDRDDKTVALPWGLKDNGETAAPTETERDIWNTYSLCQLPYIVPRTWAFNSKGELIAFEFCASESPDYTTPSVDFTRDLFLALKILGLENVFGIQRGDTSLKGKSTYETTPLGRRANVTTVGNLEETLTPGSEMIKVSWGFDKDGNVIEGPEVCILGYCYCKHCNSHTYK